MYNSQVGAVVFLCSIAFKLSALPSIVNEHTGSSTLWTYLVLTVIDTVSFALLYLFFKDGSDEELAKNKLYKIGMVFLFFYLAFKCLTFFSFAVVFFTAELFVGVSPIIVVSILIVPVVYLGVKGANVIARTSEIFVFMVFGIMLLNLVFLEAKLEIGRNLPVFSMETKEFFANSLRYGNWLGNCFPLIFAKVKNKKLPYVSTCFSAAQIIILIVVMIGVAMYGNSMKIVGNLLIGTSGFNQLSTEIGRMEWTALFAAVIMGIVEMAFLFYGATECSVRIIGSRSIMKVALPVTIFLLCVLLPSPQLIVDFSYTKTIGIVMTGLTVILPVYFLGLKLIFCKKSKSEDDAEQTDLQSNEKSLVVSSSKEVTSYGKTDILTHSNSCNMVQAKCEHEVKNAP